MELVATAVKSGNETRKICSLLIAANIDYKKVANNSGYTYTFYSENPQAFSDARKIDLRVTGAKDAFLKKYS